MPKELKKRGRREAKRQKLSHDANESETVNGKGLALSTQAFVSGEDSGNGVQLPFESSIAPGATFFGLLDEQEQEYFRKADEMLEANQFNNDEEREAFTQNVLRESENKELKMACSQGCSRLLEKLICLADPGRLKLVFQRFYGHFVHLMSHRFGSHCCEALLAAAAALAAQEYLQPAPTESESTEAHVSTENLFLYTVSELEPSIDSLLMNSFGSHVLRTLFLVLSGSPLGSPSHKTLVHSKKKEKISLVADKTADVRSQPRQVPESFREALSKIINTLTTDITRDSIRNLATDPLGSPTLQLLIELDLGRSRKYKTKIEDSLVGKLLLPQPGDEERDADTTRSFVKMLLQDTVGSHLLERVVSCVPKKTFMQLYNQYFKGQLGKLAVDEKPSFVVVKILEKLEQQELKSAEGELRAVLPQLLEEHRVLVIRSVIENCSKHGISADEFCETLFSTWNSAGVDNPLLEMLEVQQKELEDLDSQTTQEKEKKNPRLLHASLLVQALLATPGKCSEKAKEYITSCPPLTLKQLCKHQTASHALQKSLTSEPLDIAYKRKFATLLSGSIVELAIHPIGSHLVDTLWMATSNGLKLQRQRIADELLASEPILRDSFYGRAVWRNWKMDMYKTRRYDWNNIATSSNDEPNGQRVETKKSAIQLASERHAAKMSGVADSKSVADSQRKESFAPNKRKHGNRV
ncbi:hypothetical protein ABW19_dt0210627 [Dactylella cylindrospora]|nr:hypothetical protein ABW19_dt0210627 [Dactylella cylindrospora]